MSQFTTDFLSQNKHIAYPFVGPATAFNRPFVDASVSTALSGGRVVLRSWDPLGHFVVYVDSVLLVGPTDLVTKTTFGAYSIWESSSDRGQVTLVFLTATPPPAQLSCNYEFVPHVVTYGAGNDLIAVVAKSQEIAGPGQVAGIVAGPNMDAETTTDSNGNATVVLSAAFDTAKPCGSFIPATVPFISTINKIQPDKNGNFVFVGKGIFLVEKVPGTNALRLTSVGRECCSCSDYAAVFEIMRKLVGELGPINDTLSKAQSSYLQQLAYVRFLLQSPIVGSVLPGEDDRIAT